jgi:hypothetical protein
VSSSSQTSGIVASERSGLIVQPSLERRPELLP